MKSATFCNWMLSTIGTFILSVPLFTYGTTWFDPTWDELLEQAEIIGLFEVTEGGVDEGKIKPIRLFKGELPSEEFTLRGFNNNCWAPETLDLCALKTGERRYLFLSSWWQYHWGDKNRPADTNYKLHTPSPSTGMLFIEDDDYVRYSLYSPSYPWTQQKRTCAEFEEFIINTAAYQKQGTNNSIAIAKATEHIENELEKPAEESNLPYWLAVYRYWGGTASARFVESALSHSLPEARYHAVRILGTALPDPQSEKKLITLLSDENTMVQGEAVQQLMKVKKSTELGTIFASQLSRSLPGQQAPSNIMDPILNTKPGGQMALIEAIVELDYAPQRMN